MIKNYVTNGGFLFAMCSATDSFDIALAAQKVDVAHSVFDGTPIENNVPEKMDYNNALAFSNFQIIPDPMVYEYSDIDYPPSDNPVVRGAEADYFTLFEFSAKYDPVPTMLTQNHVPVVKGFMGQTTGFNREKIKKTCIGHGRRSHHTPSEIFTRKSRTGDIHLFGRARSRGLPAFCRGSPNGLVPPSELARLPADLEQYPFSRRPEKRAKDLRWISISFQEIWRRLLAFPKISQNSIRLMIFQNMKNDWMIHR